MTSLEGKTPAYDELLPYAPPPPLEPQSESASVLVPAQYVESLPLRDIMLFSMLATAISTGLIFAPDRYAMGSVVSFAFPVLAVATFAVFCMSYYERRGGQRRSISWKTFQIILLFVTTPFMFFTLSAVVMLMLTSLLASWLQWPLLGLFVHFTAFSISYPIMLVFVASGLRMRMPLSRPTTNHL